MEQETNSKIFIGYASKFNHVDAHNDVIVKGAFTKAIEQHKHNNIKLLWQHNQSHPIGRILEMVEDEKGLLIKAELLMDVAKGKEAYALIKSKAICGLSIGFSVVSAYKSGQKNTRVITDANLYEISLVTFPANEEAKVIMC